MNPEHMDPVGGSTKHKESLKEFLKFRCPLCHKLYQTEEADLHTKEPQFDCIACGALFSLKMSSPDVHGLFPTTLLKNSPFSLSMSSEEPNAMELITEKSKTCPKCGALNIFDAKECSSCQVIIQKVELLPKDPTLKAQPSLVRKWRNLVTDFENKQKHEEFLMGCHELQAHGFAHLKYTEMLRLQGGDPLCEEMLTKLQTIMDLSLTKPDPKSMKEISLWKLRLLRALHWLPIIFSLSMVILGISHGGYRNLIGVGTAFFCLTLGLLLILKGRLSLDDFWGPLN